MGRLHRRCRSWCHRVDDTVVGAERERCSPGETSAEFLARQVEERAGQNPDLDGETLRQSITGSNVEGDDDLLFVHEVFPHFPWKRTPTGSVYESRGATGNRRRCLAR